jgi:hypothetical protein
VRQVIDSFVHWSGVTSRGVGEEGRFLTAVVLFYVAFYGLFLVAAGGLPYVLDNNESFSSLWHATNLHNFGLSKSFGVTDEAYGFNPAAHPYVYTHQGNFPRLFAYLIYLLGTRSIEAQIAVTTFTVGLAAIMLAYRFFASVMTPLFGFLACLVLITDYVLVSQWQVVTYRVWYAFFVFSSALCVHACVSRFRWWRACTCINFACLFYFEFIFVAFVTVGVGLYAIALLRDPRRIAGFFAWVLAGAAIGLGMLLTQLWLLLGWEDLRRDAYLTFVARNRYLQEPQLLDEMKEFFSSRNIVFWYNLEDGSRFRRLGYFVASFTHHEFQLHTPLFTSAVALPIGGFLASVLIPRAARYPWAGKQYLAVAGLVVGAHLAHKLWRKDFGPTQFAPAAALAGMLIVWVLASLQIFSQVGTTFRSWSERTARLDRRRARAWVALMLLLLALPSLFQHVSSADSVVARYSPAFIAYIVVYVAALAWISYAVAFGQKNTIFNTPSGFRAKEWLKYSALLISLVALLAVTLSGDWAFGVRRSVAVMSGYSILWIALSLIVLVRIARGASPPPLVFSAFVLLASIGLLLSWGLYDQAYTALWGDILQRSAPGPSKYLVLYLAVLIGALLAASSTSNLLQDREVRGLKTLGIFLGCAFASYCFVYVLSPGYIFTGYKLRLAPFTVFHTNIILAFAAFILIILVRKDRGTSPIQISGQGLGFIRVGAAVLLALLVWYWAAMQFRYFQLLPPDNYHFLKRLEEPPYRGKSFIVSNYAAPIAAATGQWAYLHEGLSTGNLPMQDGRYVVEVDDKYLWLADKNSNPEYRRPDYFICAMAQSIWSVNQMVRARAGLSTIPYGCSENLLVKLAVTGPKGMVTPRVRLVEADADGPARVGFQRWAIVQLLWDGSD